MGGTNMPLFLAKHWGKLLSAGFVFVWGWFTIYLYNANQDLHEELGKSASAIEVCIAERINMDNVLKLLNDDIANIQKENEEYKIRLANAKIRIEELEEGIPVVVTEIDDTVLPESCEGVMSWMLERALK